MSDRSIAIGVDVGTCLAEIPELGHLPCKAAGALAGLAPFSRDSGTKSGKRFIRGGRAPIRAVL